jgi:S-DNA-T family DNA segregation ATPase FtsK/SpoIIIE
MHLTAKMGQFKRIMKKTTKRQTKSLIPELVMRRARECGFIALSGVALFLCVALVTHNSSDPGWSNATSSKTIVNAAGSVGAWSSDLLFTFFGSVAYLFPVLAVVAGVLLFKSYSDKPRTMLLWGLHLSGLLLVVASACALVEIGFQNSGGIIGSVLQGIFSSKLSTAGSILLFLTFFLAGATIGTGISWVQIMEFVGRATLKLLANLRDLLINKWQDWRVSRAVEPEPKRKSKPKLPPVLQDDFDNDDVDLDELVMTRPAATKAVPKVIPKVEIAPRQVVAKKIVAGNSKLPDLDLLEAAPPSDPKRHYSQAVLEKLSREVEERLLDFGAEVKVVAVCPGPIITRFEMTLAPGLKVSKITGLAKDLARSLSVTSVRVVEVIPGKAVVGLEIPNKYREIVKLRDVLESPQYQDSVGPLNLALGKDISGIPVVVNLGKMPHLLVAGTTGSGKSVGVNAMLLSLLFKATPEDLRLILIDPKMLELSIYDGIGHLLTPVVTDMNDAANALRWCVAEMERRYQLMAAVGVRNLEGFNFKVAQAIANNNPIFDPLWDPKSGGTAPKLEKLPSVVVIIDEFADMMMVVGKKVEELIARIAQKARAAGIHMILATQRPSVDVITGLIKANVPTRIAFQVSSRIDSRTILDQQGAEQLLGHGDMLYLAPGTGIPIRVHGAFVSDEEVHAVVKALKLNNPAPDYIEEISSSIGLAIPGIDAIGELGGEQDPLYDEAVSIVIDTRKASISYLQRRLKIGYNRSARLIEAMEAAGVVSAMSSNGVRELLV